MPDIKLGTVDVASMKLGTTTIAKVMLGITEIWPGAAPSAYPVVAASNTEAAASLGTANAIPAPPGISAGNLLLAFASMDSTGVTITASTGWTEVIQHLVSTAHRLAVFARIADGGANDTLSLSGSTVDYCAAILRITDHGVTTIATDIKSASAAVTSGNANPPSLATGTVRKWLWLASAAVDQAAAADTISAMPTSYTQVVNLESAASTSASLLAVAQRNLEAATEDPAAFTNTSRFWVAVTIAVPPA